MEEYLKETKLLDYNHPSIQNIIKSYKWDCLDDFEKIKNIYLFVRDAIEFGYNYDDNIPASKVLSDGYGQCNTKATLLMALLRGVGIPCRVHAFTIYKKLQKGAMTGFVYEKAPEDIFHSWVEVFLDYEWYTLEGVILDKRYVSKLQYIKNECGGAFCGYGVAVKDFRNLNIEFNRNSTYIQSEGIHNDFGIYNDPDDMYKAHKQEMRLLKKLGFMFIGRHLMNYNVKKIRNADLRNKSKYCDILK